MQRRPQKAAASGSKPWAAGLPLLAVGLVLGAALSLYPWQKAPPAAPASASAARATSVVHVPTVAEPPPVETADDAEEPDPAPDPEPTIEQPDAPKLEDLVSRVVPAVAFILAGQNRGTGFFIARDKVLTNAHVVGGQSSIRLQVGDANYTARVVSVSTGSDLAVLQVYNASATQPVLTLGSVSGARVGEEVIAVGSALGVLSNTVTRGIVSAVRKAGPVTLIQTDAAINPGNSGGPLVNRAGQVIGINSLRAGQQAEGVAFAVAIDHATQLLNGERVTDTQTPLGSLTQMLDGRSDGDQQRARGEQEYGRILEAAARAAAELDSLWDALRAELRHRHDDPGRRSALVCRLRVRCRPRGHVVHRGLPALVRGDEVPRRRVSRRSGEGRRARPPARRLPRHRPRSAPPLPPAVERVGPLGGFAAGP